MSACWFARRHSSPRPKCNRSCPIHDGSRGAGDRRVVALLGGLALTTALILLLIDPVGLKPWLAALLVAVMLGVTGWVMLQARAEGPQADRPDASADRRDHQGRHSMGEGAAAMTGFREQTNVTSRSERSPEEIEHEIQRTRERMSSNIDELGDRLSPDNSSNRPRRRSPKRRRTSSPASAIRRARPAPG